MPLNLLEGLKAKEKPESREARLKKIREAAESARKRAERLESPLGLIQEAFSQGLPKPVRQFKEKAFRFLSGFPSDEELTEEYKKVKSGMGEIVAREKIKKRVKEVVKENVGFGLVQSSPPDISFEGDKVKIDPGTQIDIFGGIGALEDITRRLSQKAISKISKAFTSKEVRTVLDKEAKGVSSSLKNQLAKRLKDVTDKKQIAREFSSRVTEEVTEQARRLGVVPGKTVEKEATKRAKAPKQPSPALAKEAPEPRNLPAVIQGDNFTLGQSRTFKATPQEIKNAQKAEQKVRKLELKERKVREEAIDRINRFRGDTDNAVEMLKSRNLSDEDIANIVLEDGTKLADTARIKRNPDRTLSTVIKKSEIEDITKNYTDEIPKEKWSKRSKLVEGAEVPLKIAKSIELPYAYFERKGLGKHIYDPIIRAGRDAETMKTLFLKRFEDAGLFKKGSWFTADRFTLSKKESEGVARYFLGRQGRGKAVELDQLSKKGRKFVEIFDEIIAETEERFFATGKKLGKTPRKVQDYAPIMTRKDIKLADEGGSMDWLFRNHPAFFSLKERQKKVPFELYELDYREVAARWLDGVTQFLNMGETTNHVKYLINSDNFAKIVKEGDQKFIADWLKNVTTVEKPTSLLGQGGVSMSRLLRKGVAMGSLGLNYGSVLKQALTQIPMMMIERARPKLKSQYAKAFGINVTDLPSITKRRGDIAISDLQGKIGRIFTGALTKFDQKNAQISMNALLDKEWKRFVKEGVEITPEVRRVIEKNVQDKIDMWYGGFFKGQRPEAFRKEIGNFILMFLYPLTSQLNGFFRHAYKAKGLSKAKAIAEVTTAATTIAYMEQVITNLSFEWSDEVGMTKDTLVSLSGNIPLASQIAWALATDQDVQISPVVGNINNIVRNIGKGEYGKAGWGVAETFGTPKQVRRIKEGLEIMEEGGITDNDGKMLAPVQDSIELIRSFLRGKYGSTAAQDWIRNIGEKREDRRWFVPQVEFLQNGNYDRKAELYQEFNLAEQEQLREFLSEAQQKRLDNALEGGGKKSLEEIFSGKKTLQDIFNKRK